MVESCPYCFIGRLHPQRRTLARLIGGTLIHLPNVPVQRCDICGHVVYDAALLRRYDVLIGESGLPPNHHAADADPLAASSPDDPADTLHDRRD